jgi:hypothetical protein
MPHEEDWDEEDEEWYDDDEDYDEFEEPEWDEELVYDPVNKKNVKS